MQFPKISLLVLTWNDKEVLARCLKSIEAIDYPNFEVVVIDNGSIDGTATMVKEMFSYAQLVEIEKNVGPGEGFNMGIRHALKNESDYIFFTNNDTILDKNILTELIKVAESDKEIGIVGPTTYWADYPERIQNAGNIINWTKGTIQPIVTEQNSVHEVDDLGFGLIGKKVLEEVGLFNSRFFCYWEDTDLCTRIKKNGYKVLCVPSAKIWHIGCHTTRKSSGFIEYQMIRNNFWFMKIHASKEQYFTFLLHTFVLRIWLQSGVYIFKNRDLIKFVSFIRGVADGVRKAP